MKNIVLTIILNLICVLTLQAQKIDTDSLLTKAAFELNTTKNYAKAKELSHLGIKNAPNYLDFHLLLGRAHWLTQQKDSARYYFNHVIAQNPKYKEAFSYLSKLEIEEKNSNNAIIVLDKAISFYPEEKEFYLLKSDAIALEKDDEKTIAYLTSLTEKYPDDKQLQNQLTELKLKSVSDRIGLGYNYTTFSRDEVGPWHLVGLQYVRERKKLTLIGRINYADRRYNGSSVNSGFQYEFETYFTTGKKSYSFANVAISDEIIFPKLRLSYSYYRNLGKGWEGDLGARYINTADADLYAAVVGIGKYTGPYWFNLKSYWQWEKDKMYPAFTATARYYFDTKFDYVTVIAGYGTSPDERVTLGQIQQRVSLNSFRIGAGYYKLLWEHYCLGLQGVLNHQEYTPDNYQNEFDLFFSIQYKF
ncbi:MAG TPA: YaiO family outer membrane beta-barrel protein [Flavobacterium sp.]|uniref:YaiO family outer membrane beta-barrel protein n=1 Tax=Flavobacterium sp. TaxID=239 RepID=UPI002D0256DD|nr:YaiO family outer membrane beta-barrel protein [Flavobacterium sp.]HSD13794.1 YaiO family outer membrane beta-barrel protein [Flavobacterium sp.]